MYASLVNKPAPISATFNGCCVLVAMTDNASLQLYKMGTVPTRITFALSCSALAQPRRDLGGHGSHKMDVSHAGFLSLGPAELKPEKSDREQILPLGIISLGSRLLWSTCRKRCRTTPG